MRLESRLGAARAPAPLCTRTHQNKEALLKRWALSTIRTHLHIMYPYIHRLFAILTFTLDHSQIFFFRQQRQTSLAWFGVG